MSKKIVTVKIVAEIEVDSEWYDNGSDEGIKEAESDNWIEWIDEHIISEEISVKDRDEK